MLCIIVLLLGW